MKEIKTDKRKSTMYWTLERCKKEALKYEIKKEWVEGSQSSYHAAYRNGWIKECTRHMRPLRKAKGYWTLERCKKEASKYETVSEWQKRSSSAFHAAYRNGWIGKKIQVIASGSVIILFL